MRNFNKTSRKRKQIFDLRRSKISNKKTLKMSNNSKKKPTIFTQKSDCNMKKLPLIVQRQLI